MENKGYYQRWEKQANHALNSKPLKLGIRHLCYLMNAHPQELLIGRISL